MIHNVTTYVVALTECVTVKMLSSSFGEVTKTHFNLTAWNVTPMNHEKCTCVDECSAHSSLSHCTMSVAATFPSLECILTGFYDNKHEQLFAPFPKDTWDTDVRMFQILKLWSVITARLLFHYITTALSLLCPWLCTLRPPSRMEAVCCDFTACPLSFFRSFSLLCVR